MKKVSIIIPVYNVEKYISDCIDSILKQTYKNYEIILIDDGSPDNCGKICDSYAKKYKFIKVIHKENEGVSVARNVGMEIASGEYLMFIDSDDLVDSKYIEKLLSCIETTKSDVCSCNYIHLYDNYEKEHYCQLGTYISKSGFLNSLCDEKKLGGFLWNKIYDHSIIKKYNIKFEKNLKIMEDLLFNIKVSKYVKKVTHLNEGLYYYRHREGSAISNKKNYNNFDALEMIINELELHKCVYSNDYKLRYLFESIKCKLLGIEPVIKMSRHRDNIKKYKKIKTFFNHGSVTLKIKIFILYIFPWVYRF